MLLLLAFLLLSLGACSGLPHDIREWNVELREQAAAYMQSSHWKMLPSRRIWDREDLHHAAVVEGFEQLRPMLDKLNSGHPITAVAFGDSITASHAGCCPMGSASDAGCIRPPGGVGWLSSLMSMINATWPHPKHRLINSGISGQTFHMTTHVMCLEAMMPSEVRVHLYVSGPN